VRYWRNYNGVLCGCISTDHRFGSRNICTVFETVRDREAEVVAVLVKAAADSVGEPVERPPNASYVQMPPPLCGPLLIGASLVTMRRPSLRRSRRAAVTTRSIAIVSSMA